MSNDWIESLKDDDDDELQKFLYELFELAYNEHAEAISDNRAGDEVYWQGAKDTIRKIFAYRNVNIEVGGIIGTSPTQITRRELNAPKP